MHRKVDMICPDSVFESGFTHVIFSSYVRGLSAGESVDLALDIDIII